MESCRACACSDRRLDRSDGWRPARDFNDNQLHRKRCRRECGGRTGLVAVTVAVLFLAALFFAPLAGSIPAFATAPALVYVACIMMSSVKEIDFSDVTEYAPAIITIAAMPLTFSIAHGIAFGFITYAGIKLLAGRLSDIKPAVAILAVLFVLKFAYL